jgi:hypothetical protein
MIRLAAAMAIALLSAVLPATAGEANRWAKADRAPADAFGPGHDPVGKCTYGISEVQEAGRQPWKLLRRADADGKVEQLDTSPLVQGSWTLLRLLAWDPVAGEALVFKPGEQPEDFGWETVLAYNPAAKAWRQLAFGDEAERRAHAARAAALDALRAIIGRTRACWYQDNGGEGTEAERKDLAERCAELAKLPEAAAIKADI